MTRVHTDIAATIAREYREGRKPAEIGAPGHATHYCYMLLVGDVRATVPTERDVRDWWGCATTA